MVPRDSPVVEPIDVAATGCLPAVISEIGALLDVLLATGLGGSIDLRTIPMLPTERAQLAAFLGEGEVGARIESLGPTLIRETGIGGVWWVQHRDEDGQLTAELIEVTYLPEILRTDPADARAGRERLREKRCLLNVGSDTDA